MPDLDPTVWRSNGITEIFFLQVLNNQVLNTRMQILSADAVLRNFSLQHLSGFDSHQTAT